MISGGFLGSAHYSHMSLRKICFDSITSDFSIMRFISFLPALGTGKHSQRQTFWLSIWHTRSQVEPGKNRNNSPYLIRLRLDWQPLTVSRLVTRVYHVLLPSLTAKDEINSTYFTILTVNSAFPSTYIKQYGLVRDEQKWK